MSPEYIIKKVELWFNVDDITASSRETNIVHCRYVYIALARKFTGFSYDFIGKKVGLNHTSCLKAFNVFNIFYTQQSFSEFKEGYLEIGNNFKELLKDSEFKEDAPNAFKFENSKLIQDIYNLPSEEFKDFEKLAKEFLENRNKVMGLEVVF
jgi:hypothetical protein